MPRCVFCFFDPHDIGDDEPLEENSPSSPDISPGTLHAHVERSHPYVDISFLPFFQTDSAFRGTVKAFVLLASVHDQGVEDLRQYLMNHLHNIIAILRAQRIPFRFCICSDVLMMKENRGDVTAHIAHFMALAREVHSDGAIVNTLMDVIQESTGRIENYQREGSGFVSTDVQKVQLCISAVKTKKFGCEGVLPTNLAKRRNVLTNIHLPAHKEGECFKYNTLALLHPEERNSWKKCENYATEYWWPSHFPVSFSDLDEFEEKNRISVYVYAYVDQGVHVSRPPKLESEKKIHLLEVDEHFFGIRSLERLLTRKNTRFVCERCTRSFNEEKSMAKHRRLCADVNEILLEFCEPGENFVEFTKIQYMQQYNYVVALDTESVLAPSGVGMQRHITSSFCAVLVRTHDSKVMRIRTHHGEDAARQCVRALMEMRDEMIALNACPAAMVLNDEQCAEHRAATHCAYCKQEFTEDLPRVRHHDHSKHCSAGETNYIATLCNPCNVACTTREKLPIMVHNLSYDLAGLLREFHILGWKRPPFIVASSMEKIRSFEIGTFLFRDTMQYLNSSLGELVETVKSMGGAEAFQCLKQAFGNDYEILLRKGVFPYSHVSSFAVYDELALPEKSSFRNDLTGEDISEEDYQYALLVFEHFGCSNLRDYNALYLKTDALLHADVMQHFRRLCYSARGLELLHCVSLASYSWQCALNYTQAKLELIIDEDMYRTIESGVRGGLCQASRRHLRANNPLCSGYDPDKEEVYISYIDCNNLYGFSMIKHLPVGDFEWVEDFSSVDFMRHPTDSDVGYVYVCDLEYPKSIHALTRYFPLAPEKAVVPKEWLSPFQQGLLEELMYQPANSKKLLLTCKDKVEYVVHYALLALYCRLGMRVTKIHRILKFRQAPFLRPYIEDNVARRVASGTTFEKNFYKLSNNAVFGRTLLNKFNMRDIRVAFDEETASRLGSRAECVRMEILSPDCVMYEMRKRKVRCDFPLQIGFTILELSKLTMYSFYYETLLSKLTCPVITCYFDTDSLILGLFCKDYEDQLRAIADDHLDLSSFDRDHPLYSEKNRGRLGAFKSETGSVPIEEVVCLKAKMYSIKLAGGRQIARAKGVKKNIVRKHLLHETYCNTLFNHMSVSNEQVSIVGKKQCMYTIRNVKRSLMAYDDKRYLCNDIDSYPYGSYEYDVQEEN
ncbi:uncharacterized protein LOC135376619 isoform X2 [Ornithodoros turicata]|uniref:uncharacterized protein LOC135376619 isoform X2 n=1 Tax=Ornithodoros turicata TaxID=34597 RepID=UPI0031395974